MITYCDGDILSVDTNIDGNMILHQCNCVSWNAYGVAKEIFDKYPSSNIYRSRSEDSIPGTISISYPIINLFGQYRPGKAIHPETNVQRLEWFRSGLNELLTQIPKEVTCINIPYKIGCGLAGGDWECYLNELTSFSLELPLSAYIKIWKLK